ncbi:MAG: NAD-dependent epimerase/dehydratase family protein [Bacteroidota bacterium]|jgi:nucleoside-diphosphate-sugar epimerase|nr:NAD-dependent epimerase/dehydratase family protein [Bacteroidota bacterium]
MKRIVITGANGLIGSHVAEYFHARGHRPLCLVRDASRAGFLHVLGLEVWEADVTQPAQLQAAFTGADTVIHTAGKVGEWGGREDFHRVNVDGTVNVLQTAIASAVDLVIITGSNSCYGEEDSREIKNEESPLQSHYRYFLHRILPSGLNHYRDSKALATVLAREIAERAAANLTIIDPVWVYGEREFRSGFLEYLRTVRSGIPFFPGSEKNRFHTIYARDLAALYYRVASVRPRGVHRFMACDAEAENMRVLLGMFCDAAGLRLPRRLPKSFAYPPALLLEAVAMLFRVRSAPLLTRATVNIFYDNVECSGEKARHVLGFVPTTPREESIRRTINWYRERHLL